MGLPRSARLGRRDSAALSGVTIRQSAGPVSVQVVVGDVSGSGTGPGVRVGFAAGKSLGNAVVRNRVRRRLREAVRPLLASLREASAGRETLVIVRVRPAVVELSSAQLHDYVLRALDGTVARGAKRARASAGESP